MAYTVTIASSDGNTNTYACAGRTDQEALIYAGKVIEEKADRDDRKATFVVQRDGESIGPTSTIEEIVAKTF